MITIGVAVLCAVWGYQARPLIWPAATVAAGLALGVLGFLVTQQGRIGFGLPARDPLIWFISAIAINGIVGFAGYGIGRLIGRRQAG